MPIVSGLDAVAVTVVDPPKETLFPLMVIALYCKLALPIAIVVFVTPVNTPLALTAKTGTEEAVP